MTLHEATLEVRGEILFWATTAVLIILSLVLVTLLTPHILGGISWAWAATHPYYPCSSFGFCAGPGGLGP